MSLVFYKWVHLFGVIMVFTALGGALFASLQNPDKKSLAGRKVIGALHGGGLLLALVGGFGLMARMQLKLSQHGWLHGKMLMWLAFGASLAFLYKTAKPKKLRWVPILLLMAALTLWLVEWKPFTSFQ